MPVPRHLNDDNLSGPPGRSQSLGQTWPAGPGLEKPEIETIPQTLALVRLQLKWAGRGHIFLVAPGPRGGEAGPAAAAAYRQIVRVLHDQDLTVVQERLFGSLAAEPEVMAARTNAFRDCGLDPEVPLSCIQGHPPWGQGLAGIIISALTGQAVQTVWHQGQAVGRSWQQGGARFLVLQNLQGRPAGSSPWSPITGP